MNEHPAVTKARSSGDVGVLLGTLVIIFSIITGFLLVTFILAVIAESEGNSEEGIMSFLFSIFGYVVIAAATLVFSMVTIRMMRQMNLGNALHVQYSDYAWLREWSQTVAAELRMKPVEIFITQDPVMNAYAFGFMSPYNIVLSSASIRYLTQDELKAVVIHEMAHVKYNHTIISTYLSVLRSIPVVGSLFGYMLDFWGRRTELTCDRLAVCYLQNPELVKQALIKVHVGPDAASAHNTLARKWQAHNSNNWFNGLSQTFSSHPFLVRRLANIDEAATRLLPPPPAEHVPAKVQTPV